MELYQKIQDSSEDFGETSTMRLMQVKAE